MTSLPGNGSPKNQWFLNLAIAGLLGQVGCLTLVIILGALFLGLWLDSRFQTRPLFTLIIVIASIPISLLVMFLVTRAGLARIKPQLSQPKKAGDEEADIGKYN